MVRRAVEEFLRRSEIVGPIVVGVSGGADSVCLLLIIAELCPGQVIVGHVQHSLRGEASAVDEAFVRQLASAQRLPCVVQSIDPGSQPGNLEANARRLRYQALARIAEATNARYVAVGHHADDQAETVLHHILRGTGIGGLRGIAVGRPLSPTVQLMRPLLHVPRTEILAYLQARQQLYRNDETNFDLNYTRNRLRHTILPFLLQETPQLIERLGRLAEHASEVESLLERYSGVTLTQYERPRAGATVVVAISLGQEPAALVRRVLRSIWQREGWPQAEMTASHWQRAAALFASDTTTPAHDFPSGIHARRRGQVVCFGPRS